MIQYNTCFDRWGIRRKVPTVMIGKQDTCFADEQNLAVMTTTL
jgi:hypothetical protein